MMVSKRGRIRQYLHSSSSIKKKVWSRSEACVHRSQAGDNAKRVILSLGLVDGRDDQKL